MGIGILGAALDVYEIYHAENKLKAITKAGAGWAGAALAAKGAAIGMSWLNGAPGPGTLDRGLVIFGAGIAEYFLASEATEWVWQFFVKEVPNNQSMERAFTRTGR